MGLTYLEVGEADDGCLISCSGHCGWDIGLSEDGVKVVVGEALSLLQLDSAGLPGDLLVGAISEADRLAALHDRPHGDVTEERVLTLVGRAPALELGAVTAHGRLGSVELLSDLHVGALLLHGEQVVGDDRLIERCHIVLSVYCCESGPGESTLNPGPQSFPTRTHPLPRTLTYYHTDEGAAR